MTAKEFRDIMQTAGRRMLIAALRVTASETDAEDAVQEAMYRLWKNRKSLAQAGNPESYATSAARHCALDIVKARRIASSLAEVTERPSESIRQSDARDDFAIVLQIVESLPSPQREVITMRDVQGHEMDEIEKELNLTAANARVILSRARSAVRKMFLSYD